jgi:Na+/glutamate symporter
MDAISTFWPWLVGVAVEAAVEVATAATPVGLVAGGVVVGAVVALADKLVTWWIEEERKEKKKIEEERKEKEHQGDQYPQQGH